MHNFNDIKKKKEFSKSNNMHGSRFISDVSIFVFSFEGCDQISVRNFKQDSAVNGVYHLNESHICSDKPSYVKDDKERLFSYTSNGWMLGDDLNVCTQNSTYAVTTNKIWENTDDVFIHCTG